MPAADDLPHLRAAFDSLLAVADPARAVPVLRRALVMLLADATAPARPLVPRSPAIGAVDREDWAALKPRLRAEIELRGMSLPMLAGASGIPLSTLQKCLSPAGATPGKLIYDALAGWLDNFPQKKIAPATAPIAGTAAADASSEPATGAVAGQSASLMPAKNLSADETAGSAPEPPASRIETALSHPGNGHDRIPEPGGREQSPRRLTAAERERLAFVAASDPESVRRVASLELAARAIGGAELPGAAVARLIAALG